MVRRRDNNIQGDGSGMDSYRAYIECTCSEHVLIDVFNFLDEVFHREYAFQAGLDWAPSFAFRLLELRRGYRPYTVSSPEATISQVKRFLSFGQDDLDRTQIILTITIEDDAELDIFTYRYFFLILNKLLRKQDRAYLDCPDVYYHKIGSYFFLQTLSQASVELRQRSVGGKAKKLPQVFSLSSEWLPAIYLHNRSSEVYEVLANPLFKNIEGLKAALQTHRENAGRLSFSQDSGLRRKPVREQYASCLEHYFAGWLSGMLAEIEIAERLYSTPGISQLLFALLCGKIWGQKKRPSLHDAEKLLEICCDFGDCILQVAENIVSHTEGGVLSVRINDNWDKIKDVFKAKHPETANWYMRISLVDFSRSSILDNVKRKSGIDMGSTVFCRREQLDACLEKGLVLEESVKAAGSENVEPFSEFLCIQIKKMLFVTQDCASRTAELQHILELCIRDELEERGEAVEEKT